MKRLVKTILVAVTHLGTARVYTFSGQKQRVV
jgi:hypothetical protein